MTDFVEDRVDWITREQLAEEGLSDADRDEFDPGYDIPFPETGAEPAQAAGPGQDAGVSEDQREGEEAPDGRAGHPEERGETAPEGAEREPATELTPEQIAEAEKAAAEWRPANKT